jgi:16S rRNA (adenine1518-N6/adenine1519-N6)-dimethyltransferase
MKDVPESGADKPMIDLCRPSDVRTLVTQLGFHPSRALGQNFLVDRNILDIFLDAAELNTEDRVLEVGPGLGVLTAEVLALVGHLTAVEKDHRLFEWLSECLPVGDNFRLIDGDVLDIGIPTLLADGVDKFISNLPYTPGSRILMDLVRDDNAPRDIIVTVQLEVAQRITAVPGSKTYGLMAVWSRLHYEAEIVKIISPNCFWPRPDVKSAIVKMRRRNTPVLLPEYEEIFYTLTRYVFQHRRKQLASILAKAPENLRLAPDECRALLESMGSAVSARPEELDLRQWCNLTEKLVRH